MVLLRFALCRAGFEPLSWLDYGPSFRIGGRSVFLGGITTHPTAHNPARIRLAKNDPWARRVFRPTVPSYREAVFGPGWFKCWSKNFSMAL